MNYQFDIYTSSHYNHQKQQSHSEVNPLYDIFYREIQFQSQKRQNLKYQILNELPTSAKIAGSQIEKPVYTSIINQQQKTIVQQKVPELASFRTHQVLIYPQYIDSKILKCKKGHRNETNNIGKDLQTLTNRILTCFQESRMFNSKEQVSVRQFQESNGTKSDFKRLFMNRQLHKRCLEMFSKTYFIKQILTSRRMSFKTKMIMIKHLQRLRTTGMSESRGWKLLIFNNDGVSI